MRDLLAELVPTFGEQGRLTASAARALGLAPGIPVTFRAGDQPANALSLNALEPGEIAATAGTSGVVYGVTDVVRADPRSRVGSFAHVNHAKDRVRLGVLLCINGTGSANRWLRQTLGRKAYEDLNDAGATVSVGAEGLSFYPFGNGAERMLENVDPGAAFRGLRFNTHGEAHLARAVQEGIAFSFRYGIEILGEIGLQPKRLRAGSGNLFLSSVFRDALAGVTGLAIELYRDRRSGRAPPRGALWGRRSIGRLPKRSAVSRSRRRSSPTPGLPLATGKRTKRGSRDSARIWARRHHPRRKLPEDPECPERRRARRLVATGVARREGGVDRGAATSRDELEVKHSTPIAIREPSLEWNRVRDRRDGSGSRAVLVAASA